MTIIIGARLDDGQRILIADGNVIRGDGERVRRDATKIQTVTSTYKSKKALIGVSGTRGDLHVLNDVVSAYMTSPSPEPFDIFYRLSERVKSLGVEWESNATCWIPNKDDYQLIQIDGGMYPYIVDNQNYAADGTGRTHALGALLGLAKRAALTELSPETHPARPSEVLVRAHHSTWKPSMDDVMIAYDVACTNDTYCGGLYTLLSI